MSSRLPRYSLALALAVGLTAGVSAQSYQAPEDADQPGAFVVRSASAPGAVDDSDPGGRSQPTARPANEVTASDQDAAVAFGTWPTPVEAVALQGPLADGRDGSAPIVQAMAVYSGDLADGRDSSEPVALRSASAVYTGPLRDGRPDGPRTATLATDDVAPQQVAPAVAAATTGEASLVVVRPNPVRGRAAIAFSLAERAAVTVTIYDVQGRVVATAFEGVAEADVEHLAAFDSDQVAPGTYVAVLTADGTRTSRTFQVVR